MSSFATAQVQAPNITYGATSAMLKVGTPFTATITNSGGAVPATIYGQVTTFAGSADGLDDMEGIVGDASGNIYIAEYTNRDIKKITPDGVVTTIAGSTGVSGNHDDIGTAALFGGPDGLAIDAAGTTLYISDYDNNSIRKLNLVTGQVTTWVTEVYGAAGLSFDNAGNLIVAEQDANQIQKITPAGLVSTIAGDQNFPAQYADGTGANARFNSPTDVQVDASTGDIYVADWLNNTIRKINSAGVVTTFAGNPTGGYSDGTGTAAHFNLPIGVAMLGNVLYVADWHNRDLRKILPDQTVSLAAGSLTQQTGSTDGIGSDATFTDVLDMWIDNSGVGYLTDGWNDNIRKVVLTGYTISPALPQGLTFDQTTGQISGTPTAPFLPTIYTITGFNTAGYAATTITLSCLNNWLGSVSNDWNDPGNWSFGTVPATSETVQIGAAPYQGAMQQPTLNADATVNGLQFGVNNSPVLTIATGKTLTLTGGFLGNASCSAIIAGPGNLTLGGSSVINATGSVTAASNLVITLSASSTLTNNGTFTLASDANGSASIAAIPSTSSVAGNISVQRYISGIRGYRLMSSPVFNGTANGNNIYSINYLAENTYMSGTNFTTTTWTRPGNPSLYLYRENMTPAYTTFLNSCFRGISDISNPLSYPINIDIGPANIPVANGYLSYFRGGIGTATPYVAGSVAAPATVTATGTLNQGTINFRDWFTPTSGNLSYTPSSPIGTIGFNLVGNPYASSIDWDQFSQSLSSNGIYGPGVATYIEVLNPQTGSYGTYYAGSGLSGPLNNNGASNIIPSGAGFFVFALNSSATLTLNENAKTPSQITGLNPVMSKTVQNNVNYQYLKLQMTKDSLHNENIVVYFNDNAKTTFDFAADALYIKGFAPVSLSSSSSDHVALAINQQPLPKQAATRIGLNISASESGTYTMSLKDFAGLPRLYDIWLMDNYKKDSVDMRANPSHPFDISPHDTASFGSNRFVVVLRQNPAYAYKLIDFAANKVSNVRQVNVIWDTKYEGNYTHFTVEKSIDNGATYQVLGGVAAADLGTYSFLDKNPANGTNLYRLKQEDINNNISYSKIVTVQYANTNNIISHNLSVYPNPAGSTVNLAISAQSSDAAAYNIRIVSSTGLIVKEAISSQASWQGNISNLLPGTYVVRVMNNKTQSFVGESKLVKL